MLIKHSEKSHFNSESENRMNLNFSTSATNRSIVYNCSQFVFCFVLCLFLCFFFLTKDAYTHVISHAVITAGETQKTPGRTVI